jgi:hypothetical protein
MNDIQRLIDREESADETTEPLLLFIGVPGSRQSRVKAPAGWIYWLDEAATAPGTDACRAQDKAKCLAGSVMDGRKNPFRGR